LTTVEPPEDVLEVAICAFTTMYSLENKKADNESKT
jgi:uncharacterized protein YqhQ